MAGFFLVEVVQPGGLQAPTVFQPLGPFVRRWPKVSWKQTVKLALDKVHFYSLQNEIVSWEPVPLHSQAKTKTKLSDMRKVGPDVLIIGQRGSGAKTGQLLGLEDVEHRHGCVVVGCEIWTASWYQSRWMR